MGTFNLIFQPSDLRGEAQVDPGASVHCPNAEVILARILTHITILQSRSFITEITVWKLE